LECTLPTVTNLSFPCKK